MNRDTQHRPYVGRPRDDTTRKDSAAFVLSPPYVHGRVRPVTAAVPADENQMLGVSVPPSIRPIEEFPDNLPSIDEFAPTKAFAPVPVEEQGWPSWGGEEAVAAPAGEWGSTDWQGFDWAGVASLSGGSVDLAAAQAWATTDWDNPRDPVRPTQSAAEALAEALNQIAVRIRAGEVRLPGSDRVKDESAIAATLAALLGVRR